MLVPRMIRSALSHIVAADYRPGDVVDGGEDSRSSACPNPSM